MDWQSLLTTVSVSTVAIAAVAWVTKALISQWLAKDVERFKVTLATESTRSIEELRTGLQLEAQRQQIVFSSLGTASGAARTVSWGADPTRAFTGAACALSPDHEAGDSGGDSGRRCSNGDMVVEPGPPLSGAESAPNRNSRFWAGSDAPKLRVRGDWPASLRRGDEEDTTKVSQPRQLEVFLRCR